MKVLSNLQNGSDIRGIAISTPEYEANLTEERVAYIASGVVRWLCQTPELAARYQEGTLTIGVGRDSRLSGPSLSQSFIERLVKEGVQVIDFELATTPALFMSTQFEAFKCDAGVMFTASHLPYYFNGIKLFTAIGGAEHEDITYILSHPIENQNGHTGRVQQADLLSPYATFLVDKIRAGINPSISKPLAGLHIIVDAGNGAGGFFAEKVLAELGAWTEGSQFLEPDGHFPNHIPNPDNKEAMQSLQEAMMRTQADLGVIFDTDVDRAAVVTRSGQSLNRNNLIAVLAHIVLNEHPGASIVTNSPTSTHLKRFIESLGGHQVRYVSGYRNVINKMIALNQAGVDCPLAIETSGHAAFRENYNLDDGAYIISKILMLLPSLREQGQSLDDVIAQLQQPAQTQEVRFKLEAEDYRALGNRVIQDLSVYNLPGWTQDHENEEGVRFDLDERYGNGWCLLRMSLHEPLLVLQVELDQTGHLTEVLQQLHTFFNQYETVNQDKLLPLL